MAKKIREILRDPRYVQFQERYYDNLVAYVRAIPATSPAGSRWSSLKP